MTIRKRLLSAFTGLVAGFVIGGLLWLLDYFVANDADHLVGLVIGLTLGCGIMAFLFPIPGYWGFLGAGLKGLSSAGGTFPDPVERRGEDRD